MNKRKNRNLGQVYGRESTTGICLGGPNSLPKQSVSSSGVNSDETMIIDTDQSMILSSVTQENEANFN